MVPVREGSSSGEAMDMVTRAVPLTSLANNAIILVAELQEGGWLTAQAAAMMVRRIKRNDSKVWGISLTLKFGQHGKIEKTAKTC